MHLNDVLHKTRISVIYMCFIPTIWMSTFDSLMVLVPPYPFRFYGAFAIEFMIVIPFPFREGFVAFLTLVKCFDFAPFLAWD